MAGSTRWTAVRADRYSWERICPHLWIHWWQQDVRRSSEDGNGCFRGLTVVTWEPCMYNNMQCTICRVCFWAMVTCSHCEVTLKLTQSYSPCELTVQMRWWFELRVVRHVKIIIVMRKKQHYIIIVTKYTCIYNLYFFPKWNKNISQHFNTSKVFTWMWRESIGWTTFVVWVAVVWLLSKKCYQNRFSWNGHWGASSIS